MNRWTRRLGFWFTLVLATGLSPMARPDDLPVPTRPPGAPLRIVTSFYPVYIATVNVAGDLPGVEVVNLVKPYVGCLHEYALTPDDLVRLSRADLLIINGAGMETFLDKVVRQYPRLTMIDASVGIDLIQTAGIPNPHIWVSVSNALRQAQNIARALGRHDAARAALYQRNAERYCARLAELQTRMQAALRAVHTHDIITFHEAFPYFAREFNLRVVGIIEREPGAEPNSRELADTIRLVRQTGARALFAEPQYPARAAELIARETGARLYTLDPAVTGPLAPDAYLAIMEKNLAELQRALK